ncbi:MAG: Adaptive-response sensory-kinase SasA [Phycisphaerae bacterium]|nr:Adaptive-response sensory-kinase SasA [Phycisphaerae bacterium]
MDTEAEILNLPESLRLLTADREALPWLDRLACARQLMAVFRAGGVVDREAVMVPLLNLLADDPKWEVRKAIADGLHYVRQGDFEPLAAKLRQDPNAFVSRAAEVSRNRRRKVKSALRQKLQGIDLVLELYQHLRERHGDEVARTAMRIGETYHMALASNLAHEMKNDLSVLQGRVAALRQAILNGEYDPATAFASLEKVGGILGRYSYLVQQMLEYARSRATPTRPSVRSLDGLVHSAAARIADLATSKPGWSRVDLDVDVQQGLVVYVTEPQLERAIFNVLSNAFDAAAMASQPHVVLTGKAINAGEVAIVIEDNGPGLEPAELNELFTPGRTTKDGGSGFGLVIARNYVEIHDGELVAASAPGEGTTMTIVLPRTISGGGHAASSGGG